MSVTLFGAPSRFCYRCVCFHSLERFGPFDRICTEQLQQSKERAKNQREHRARILRERLREKGRRARQEAEANVDAHLFLPNQEHIASVEPANFASGSRRDVPLFPTVQPVIPLSSSPALLPLEWHSKNTSQVSVLVEDLCSDTIAACDEPELNLQPAEKTNMEVRVSNMTETPHFTGAKRSATVIPRHQTPAVANVAGGIPANPQRLREPFDREDVAPQLQPRSFPSNLMFNDLRSCMNGWMRSVEEQQPHEEQQRLQRRRLCEQAHASLQREKRELQEHEHFPLGRSDTVDGAANAAAGHFQFPEILRDTFSTYSSDDGEQRHGLTPEHVQSPLLFKAKAMPNVTRPIDFQPYSTRADHRTAAARAVFNRNAALHASRADEEVDMAQVSLLQAEESRAPTPGNIRTRVGPYENTLYRDAQDAGHTRDDPKMFTMWAKLDGFDPGALPSGGLAQEHQRWLRSMVPGAVPGSVTGTIQPGCTLLTVDCLLKQSDARVLFGGLEVLATSLISGPLGLRGDVTVGVGDRALVCVADRITYSPRDSSLVASPLGSGSSNFSRKITLEASRLKPGEETAAAECAAVLRASRKGGSSEKIEEGLMRARPSCIWTAAGDASQLHERYSTVLVTVPAAAFAGCALRCRASGRVVPVAIKSVHRYTTRVQTKDGGTLLAEMLQLSVHINATGVDGFGFLDIVRNDFFQPADRSLETRREGTTSQTPDSPGVQERAERADDDGPDPSLLVARLTAGVSVGLPAITILMTSEKTVYHNLLDVLSDVDAHSTSGDGVDDAGDDSFATGIADHASTLYALGSLLRGAAPPRQAFQLTCWSASMGRRSRALTRRLLTSYESITSEEAAACMLLHATASGDLETVREVLYHCGKAAGNLGFDVRTLAGYPVGVDDESPLCRAINLNATASGDASVFTELLSTLSEPLAWSLRRWPDTKTQASGLSLRGSPLLDEAIGAATALLVRVICSMSPEGGAGGGGGDVVDDGDVINEDDVIRRALSVSSLLVSASRMHAKNTPLDRVRAAVTSELLSGAHSASRLLSVAERFHRLPSRAGDDDACDSQLRVFVDAALKSWRVKPGWRALLGAGQQSVKRQMEEVATHADKIKGSWRKREKMALRLEKQLGVAPPKQSLVKEHAAQLGLLDAGESTMGS